MNLVRWSAQHTGHLYLQENLPGTHFRLRLTQPQGHSAAGRITPIKIPLTDSGIKPATFRLVAQCATACPQITKQ